ncbi:MAG TPA: penicillin-binding transpeptidase domain-containing protein [Candidatus Limnocylindrales bacterium]|nr:penicillin-binding transpeptidase domain-containing protein [Candidatus Limnocylindrales bacterium]
MRIAPAVLFAIVFVLGACEAAQPQPDAVAKTYAEAWQKSDYQKMWALLSESSQQRVGTEGFIDRLPRIAQEMTLTSLEVKVGASSRPQIGGSPDARNATVPLDILFHTTRVGDVRRTTTLALVYVGEKDKGVWKIEWSPTAILPTLTPGRLVRMTRVNTTRGRILARDGSELATFTDAALVGIVPGQMRSPAATITSLAPTLGLTEDAIRAKLAQPWVTNDTFVPVRTLAGPALDAARAKLAVIEGVQVQPTRMRSYPTGLAAQTLGYLVEASDADASKPDRVKRGVQAGDMIGKADSGLEATLDDVLGGTYGWRLTVIEPNGTAVETLAEIAPIPGQDVVLSLNITLQRAAESALGDRRGAIVAEDPWSGEILAIASRPSYDLNAFISGDVAAIAKYTNDPLKPLFNRATFGQYATGSSFKPITAAAALREGLYKYGDKIDCPLRWTGYGEQFAQLNHETGNLGLIDLRTAMARSCNTFFYELGKRLNDRNADLLPNAAKSFGLGKATDIDYVLEADGVVPSPAWKQAAFSNASDKIWNPGDATNLAIGQGFLLATPIQMANYAAALANDGIVWKPRLVTELRDRSGAKTKTFEKAMLGHANATNTELSLIRDTMRAVVSDGDGTAFFPFRNFPVSVAGKSGTAETPGDPNGWFIGFGNFEQPSIAFAGVLEQVKEQPGTFASQVSAAAIRLVLAADFGVN